MGSVRGSNSQHQVWNWQRKTGAVTWTLSMMESQPLPKYCHKLHIYMSVQSAIVMHTNWKNVSRIDFDCWANCPYDANSLIWGDVDQPGHFTFALATETMWPLPPMPSNEINNPHTIWSHPHLFDIVTPINMDCLPFYLVSHPNQPLVSCHSWPMLWFLAPHNHWVSQLTYYCWQFILVTQGCHAHGLHMDPVHHGGCPWAFLTGFWPLSSGDD